jgi:hypothetical protein
MVGAFLTATFWILIFLAWQSGDRAVAACMAGGVFLLGTILIWLGHNRVPAAKEEDAGGWNGSICGLIFLALLNWRLDVWLAPMYGGSLETVGRVLPMAIIHWLSVVLMGWTAGLVFLTRVEGRDRAE